MKIQSVIDRALSDPEFASQLAVKVSRIGQHGAKPAEAARQDWEDVLKEFAESPDELSHLMSVADPVDGSTTWTTTVTTTTLTTTTMICTTTTTTSVTTITTATMVKEE